MSNQCMGGRFRVGTCLLLAAGLLTGTPQVRADDQAPFSPPVAVSVASLAGHTTDFVGGAQPCLAGSPCRESIRHPASQVRSRSGNGEPAQRLNSFYLGPERNVKVKFTGRRIKVRWWF